MNPAQHEVLTLHHDVLARLAPADNILESKTFLASIGKAERMMAQLPGLSHVVGGFSMRAWRMATAIVETPLLCARLGMAAHLLRLEDLAELVQVMLEETEAGDPDFAPEHVAQGGERPTGRVAPDRTFRQPRSSQPRRLGALDAWKRPVRRVIQEVRAALAGMPTRATDSLTGRPDSMEPRAADVSLRGLTPVAATPQTVLPAPAPWASSTALDRFRIAERQSIRRVGPPEQAAWAARAAPIAQAGVSQAPDRNDIATERPLLAVGPNEVSETATSPRHPKAYETTSRFRPPGPTPREPASNHRALNAWVAHATISEGTQAVARHFAGPRAAASAFSTGAPTDRASVYVAAMAPRWQRTLGVWAHAEGVAPTASRPVDRERHRQRSSRLEATANHQNRALGGGERVTLSLPAATPAAFGQEPRAIDGVGLPQGLSGKSDEFHASAAAAGRVGLRGAAAMPASGQRHGGENPVSTARADLAGSRSAWRPWRMGESERTSVALAVDLAATSAAADAATRPTVREKFGPRANAVAGAISAVVARAARGIATSKPTHGLRQLIHPEAIGRDVDTAPMRSALPFGRREAPSPWPVEAAGATRPRTAAHANDLAWLRPDDAVDDATETTTGARTAARAPRMLAAGSTPALVPTALRAALAVFGERSTAQPDGSVAAAYLARFFDRPVPVGAQHRAAELTHLRLNAADDVGHASPAAAERHAAPEAGPVLRGAAALEALAAGPAAAEALLRHAGQRENQLSDAAPVPFKPRAPATAVDSARPKGAISVWPSAHVHHFSPVGLERGRGLLARGARRTDRSPLPRRATTKPWTAPRGAFSVAAGYGQAALGPSELLGLHPFDVPGFFGEGSATPNGLRGAHALASWIAERRVGTAVRKPASPGTRPVHLDPAAAVLPAHRPDRAAWGDQAEAGPRHVPTNFSYRPAGYGAAPQATLLEGGGAAAHHADATARATGPSASTRATQASRMARVLSVTDSPTGDMLPLIAPAAHAIVTAAAAKPQSEPVGGYGPSEGTAPPSAPSHGSADRHFGDAAPGQDAEDVDALAARIARSVLLRMQRERERRGEYG